MPAMADGKLLDAFWLPLARRAGWRGDVRRVGIDLLGRYAEPQRAYHTARHLADCLAATGDGLLTFDDPVAVAAALWFHDAVYDPRRADNEAASAELAAERLAEMGETPERIGRVRGLILDTAHRTEPSMTDGRCVVDIDLSILGKKPLAFDNYDAAIRWEYAHVPAAAYRTARASVLRAFLLRPAIYYTAEFASRYERQARVNLRRALVRLTSR
jgi:predicted metal-dependent HD superfamily phosphohydrolase